MEEKRYIISGYCHIKNYKNCDLLPYFATHWNKSQLIDAKSFTINIPEIMYNQYNVARVKRTFVNEDEISIWARCVRSTTAAR